MYDVLIIGAGVIGASVARAISKYDLKVIVVDKHSDVCEGTSKANSGIVHSGYDAKPGTLKAKFNLIGNKMMGEFCQRYRVPFRRNGSLVLAFDVNEIPKLEALKTQGTLNGVEGLEVLSKEQVLAMEPNLSSQVAAALYAPTGGIVDPFELTISQAEVANQNGVEFQFNSLVSSIVKQTSHFQVFVNDTMIESKTVINCAGVFSDEINNQLSAHKLKITPRKGEYCLFDKEVGHFVDRTIFQLPTAYGKGVLVTPTAENNLLIGPTAYDIDDKYDNSTTAEGIKEVLSKASQSVKSIPTSFIITAFSGLRATETSGDFIIGEAKDVEGFYNAAGIESPGLTAAPAIGDYLADLVTKKLNAKMKTSYIDGRADLVRFEPLSVADKSKLIESNHEFGKIICRCEMVTLAEIKDAIHRPVGATTIDGVKRRTRAGAGRCQGGFCGPKVLEILSKELHKDPREIAKFDQQAILLVGFDKENL
ncbi:MAG: FAD/NAD(P)-binding oxidoreductase [Tenericutes bacterium HGW-Tenericutes-1]|jgi:glycerol-3-phosphate dehydrogenase|nr:MAG: FAD/NAD(P)-binding oxidoreductase [Tenericutes bacterium HGW-Tenericutes-1]